MIDWKILALQMLVAGVAGALIAWPVGATINTALLIAIAAAFVRGALQVFAEANVQKSVLGPQAHVQKSWTQIWKEVF